MQPSQVVEFMRDLERNGFAVWVAGGWAVDALVGRQTREHGDLDLAVDADQLGELLEHLGVLGFELTVNWLPSRAELTARDGRRVDLHPVSFAPDGFGVQTGLGNETFDYPEGSFAEGSIAGVTVRCLSLERQLAFRVGYEPRHVDVHDVALLNSLGASDQPDDRG